MAAKYRKVWSQLWADAKLRPLSDAAKLVFLHLITNQQQTGLGAFQNGAAGLAPQLGWTAARYTKALRELEKAGMVMYDATAPLVYLPNFLRWNPPESPNAVGGLSHFIEELPECDLRDEVLVRTGQWAREALVGERADWMKNVAECFTRLPASRAQASLFPGQPSAAPAKAPAKEKAAKQFPELPDWVPREQWDDFVEMRRAKGSRAPWTPGAMKEALRDLAKLRADKEDPAAVLALSTSRGWAGLFSAKGRGPEKKDAATAPAARREMR